MIYYNCLNCNSPEPDPVRQTQTAPKPSVTTQQINQMETAMAVGMAILRFLPWVLPN